MNVAWFDLVDIVVLASKEHGVLDGGSRTAVVVIDAGIIAATGAGEFVAGDGSVHRVRNKLVETRLSGSALKPGHDIVVAHAL